VVERSSSLDNPNWTVISPTLTGNGEDKEFTDPNAGDNSQFYRVRVVE
jgi:hypothetical protein